MCSIPDKILCCVIIPTILNPDTIDDITIDKPVIAESSIDRHYTDISIKKILTGDELKINDKNYSVKDKNGNFFYLGKLIKKSKRFHPNNPDMKSKHDAIYEFQYMPSYKNMISDVFQTSMDIFYCSKIFYEI